MVGIFGNRGYTPFLPVQDEYGGVARPMGILSGEQAPTPQSQGGGIFSTSPNYEPSASDKFDIITSGLQDILASWRPQSFKGGNLDATLKKSRLHGALAKALADPNKPDWSAFRNELLANADDVGDVATAVAFGKPELKSAGNDLLSIDTLTGSVSPLYKGTPDLKIAGGMVSRDGGATWTPIPGYAQQQGQISDARAAGVARHRVGGGGSGGGVPGLGAGWRIKQ